MGCVEYLLKSANSCRLCWVLGFGFALAFVVCVAVELPGATLGATGGAVPWEGKPLRGHV